MAQKRSFENTSGLLTCCRSLEGDSLSLPQQVFRPSFNPTFCDSLNDYWKRYDEYSLYSAPGFEQGSNEQYHYTQGPTPQWPLAIDNPVDLFPDVTTPQTAYGTTLSLPNQSYSYPVRDPSPPPSYFSPYYLNTPPPSLPQAFLHPFMSPPMTFPLHADSSTIQPILIEDRPLYQLSSTSTNSPLITSRNVCRFGLYIPQRAYKTSRMDRTKRRAENIIEFSVGSSSGIPIRDALEERFSGMNGRDDYMFSNSAKSVSLRLEWPGYKSHSCQIATRDWHKVRRQITRAKLANKVARVVKQFIKPKVKPYPKIAPDGDLDADL